VIHWKGSSLGIIEVLKKAKNISVRIASIPAKIETKHLWNTNPEHDCYTTLLGILVEIWCILGCDAT
jgi:hypothetical protein